MEGLLHEAASFSKRKRKLLDVLPLLVALAAGLVILVVAYTAFAVQDTPSSPAAMAALTDPQQKPTTRQQELEAMAAALNATPSLSKEEEAMGMVETGLPPFYRLGKPLPDWDTQRQLWLAGNPHKRNYTADGRPRVLMLTGSQPGPCKAPLADYLLLRTFKNKVDYCMLQDMELFYNVAVLDEKMDNFWSKLPLVRAAMEAHPEAEWFWWVDSDVVITDMRFKLPVEKYGDYNLVLHGWDSEVYEKKSVMGLNAGSFLIRNCAWTLRFMERWASMGPKGNVRDVAGWIQSKLMRDRPPEYPGDDQAALVYFMVKEHSIWGSKIHLERSYNLNGYWLGVIAHMEEIDAQEAASPPLLEENRKKRSFVTHFAGCQPCTGDRNPAFEPHQCEREMERALAFADNQVLRRFGFHHPSLSSHRVERLP